MVEGIIGSGKTTTARWLQEFLNTHGIASELFLEGDLNHPADYESTAWIEGTGWDFLLASYPKHAATLQEIGKPDQHGGHLVEYGKMEHAFGDRLPVTLYEDLARKSVYDGTPLGVYQRLLQERWRNFAESYDREDAVIIFECCFLQNPLMKFVVQHDADVAELTAHLGGIAEMLAALNPVVIYLSPPDMRGTLARAMQERSSEWLGAVIRYHAEQSYGQTHDLRGVKGLLDFLSVRRALEQDIMANLPMQTVIVDSEVRTARWTELTALLTRWYEL